MKMTKKKARQAAAWRKYEEVLQERSEEASQENEEEAEVGRSWGPGEPRAFLFVTSL